MENNRYKAIWEQMKRNRRPLLITAGILLVLLFLLGILRSCGSTNPIDTSEETATVEDPTQELQQLIYRIQNCSRLYTTEYQVHKIITHEEAEQITVMGVKLNLPFTDRHIAIPMDATLKAYIDLGAFSSQNIQTDGEKVLVTLPDPHIEVTSAVVDHDGTLKHTTLFSGTYSAREMEALHQQGLKAIEENILKSDIFENARLSATRTLVPLITRMGYKEENIRVVFGQESYTPADLSRLIDGGTRRIEKQKE